MWLGFPFFERDDEPVSKTGGVKVAAESRCGIVRKQSEHGADGTRPNKSKRMCD